MLVACRQAGLSALGAYYAGVRARDAGRLGPPTQPPPASCPELCFADPAGRVSSNTLRRPAASAAPKKSDRARATAPSAAAGAGRPRATTAISIVVNTYNSWYYCWIRGIFLTEGFQATIRLPEVPPGGSLPPEALSIPQYRPLARRFSCAGSRLLAAPIYRPSGRADATGVERGGAPCVLAATRVTLFT
jgi:hypothetical protein